MTIPFTDIPQQYKDLKDEIDGALAQVLEKGQFILGPELEALEADIAEYCGCRHATGVASGTDALHLVLRACDIGGGDEVITTPFSFIAAAEVISYVGAKPVFADIDPATFTLDPERVEARLTERTKAILPVHLYGHPADMTRLTAIAHRHRLRLIEDCAQAIGAEWRGKRAGSFGDAGCLSFFPTKNLGAMGDGGMVVTNDERLAQRLRLLRNHGAGRRYYHDELGFNSRLDEVQAAVLRVKLKRLDGWTAARRRIAASYAQHLAEVPVKIPREASGARHVFHQYTVRLRHRDAVKDRLDRLGVRTMIYYPVAIHQQAAYRELGYPGGALPEAERAAREVLSLPIFPTLREDQVKEAAMALQTAIRGGGQSPA